MSIIDDTNLPWPLISGETLHFSHSCEYAERFGTIWLTSQRVLLRATQPTPTLQQRIDSAADETTKQDLLKVQQFQLPLTHITSHNISAATNVAKIMLKLNYTNPTAAATPQQPAAAASNVVVRFTSVTAVEDRAKWKEKLVEHQNAKTAAAAPTPAPAPVTVKREPGLAATAAPTPVVRNATAAPSAGPPRPTTSVAGKRPHSALSSAAASGASTSVASSASAIASAASATSASELQTLLKCRAALLARDTSLREVHAALVPSAVSEEEFWSGRSEMLRDEEARLGTSSTSSATAAPAGSLSSGSQRAGISSSMSSTIRPETGCNTVKFTLDASQIHSIFLEYPMVHELYQQLVPDRLDEKSFWTRYFKSQYIHSQSNVTQSNDLKKLQAEDDLFAKVNAMNDVKEQEELVKNLDPAQAELKKIQAEQAKDLATKSTLLQKKIDPSVDLTAADLANAVLFADPSKSSGSSAPSSNTTRSKKARAQTELLQRFNRHGMLVLDSNLTTTRNANIETAQVNSTTEQKLQKSYHDALATSLELIDLETEVEPTYNTLMIGSSAFHSGIGNNSSVAGGHANGTASAGNGGVKKKEVNEDTIMKTESSVRSFHSELNRLPHLRDSSSHIVHLPSSSESASILFELTSTARGMNKAAIAAKQLREEGMQQLIVFSTGNEPDMLIPNEFRDELKKRYHICTELFRHFWSSLNTRSSAKLQRVHRALDEQYQLLQGIRAHLHERSYSQLVPLLNPLVASVEMCSQTFQKWNEKEAKRVSTTNTAIKRQNMNSSPPPPPSTATANEPDQKRIKL